MGSLSNEIRRQIAAPIMAEVVRAFESALQQNTPSVSGNLKNSLKVHKVGEFRYVLFGPDYAKDVEYGVPPPMSDTWTRTHRQRYHGTLRWVTRTYTGGKRPVKIPALMGDAKGPWRVITQYSRAGLGFVQSSMQQALGTDFSEVLPKQIEITSLD